MTTSTPLRLMVRGSRTTDAERLARSLEARLSVLSELLDPAATMRELASESTIWLDPRTRFDMSLVSSIRSWFADSGESPPSAGAPLRPDFAEVEHILIADDVSLPLGRSIALARPGSVQIRGDRLIPCFGARGSQLALPWLLDAPPSLEAHLDEVNSYTGLAAKLAASAGLRPTWTDLLWRPLQFLFRALVRARGSRRKAMPRLAIEAYRQTLLTAKLWERRALSLDSPGGA